MVQKFATVFNSRCLIRLIGEKDDVIRILNQTIDNASKDINIMSIIMVGMGQDLHNVENEMEY